MGVDDLPRFGRRLFLRLLAGGGLTLMAGGLQGARAAYMYKSALQGYQKSKLPKKLQAAKINPHLKSPPAQRHTFQLTIDNGLIPGIDYYTEGAPVRAVAAGIVHFVGEQYAPAGKENIRYVRLAHDLYDGLQKEFYPRVTLYRYQAYRSTYYHVSKIVVKHWQAVKRGQVIGYGSRYGPDNAEKVKLILADQDSFVNPDDYGVGHSFMNYWDGKTDLEIKLEDMHARFDKQTRIVKKLDSFYADKEKDDIFKKIHSIITMGKFKDYPIEWSLVDKFRYLTFLYTKSPNKFPSLISAEFDSMKKDFYANQPIVLTLPFN
jgi:hypothetical protein